MSTVRLVVDDANPSKDIVAAAPIQRVTFLEAQGEETIKNEEMEETSNTLIKMFVQKPPSVLDHREYTQTGTDPGLVVIFNQLNFDKDYTVRLGTNKDVNELILTFGRLGFNVLKENIHNDLTRHEITKELKKLAALDHSQRNSLILAVLTHGEQDNVLQARDAQMFTHEFWEPFSMTNCPSLKDKPKFFIFQACKGSNFSRRDSTTQINIIPSKIYKTPLEPDMLVAFSAVEGSRSYRHILNGTWFIQEMCRNFMAYGRRDDVMTLLIRTSKCVANNYYDVTSDNKKKEEPVLIKKQMPFFVSTLTKRFYLNRSKDRTYVLHYSEEIKKIYNAFQEIASNNSKRNGNQHTSPHKQTQRMSRYD